MLVQTSFEDWKDTDGIIESIATALKEFGLNMVYDPSCLGQDGYQFIIMDGEDNKDELYTIIKDDVMAEYGYEDSQEMGEDKLAMEEDINQRIESIQEELKGKPTVIQDIPNGTKCRFNNDGMYYDDFFGLGYGEEAEISKEIFKAINNKECVVKSLETATELGEKDFEYYNIEFSDGTILTGISGCHLEVVE